MILQKRVSKTSWAGANMASSHHVWISRYMKMLYDTFSNEAQYAWLSQEPGAGLMSLSRGDSNSDMDIPDMDYSAELVVPIASI